MHTSKGVEVTMIDGFSVEGITALLIFRVTVPGATQKQPLFELLEGYLHSHYCGSASAVARANPPPRRDIAAPPIFIHQCPHAAIMTPVELEEEEKELGCWALGGGGVWGDASPLQISSAWCHCNGGAGLPPFRRPFCSRRAVLMDSAGLRLALDVHLARTFALGGGQRHGGLLQVVRSDLDVITASLAFHPWFPLGSSSPLYFQKISGSKPALVLNIWTSCLLVQMKVRCVMPGFRPGIIYFHFQPKGSPSLPAHEPQTSYCHGARRGLSPSIHRRRDFRVTLHTLREAHPPLHAYSWSWPAPNMRGSKDSVDMAGTAFCRAPGLPSFFL
ncbi:hypothetical protein BDK51DRAFT_45291 [Blyttiomyces helicus]|uniref:Uncharacterized protein n=1 Tax=Blyttiomyces helicus TaxID=388810 RepID=A0A4P9WCA7_9FUNG|nr:hypothetical protein BDK51DRAFT_45291 [Blyttiomyces helicus]|eukprot:RKO90134.1 hypothetical protein BDK51DRAFT_45291 [Blyttiomyces helicus]